MIICCCGSGIGNITEMFVLTDEDRSLYEITDIASMVAFYVQLVVAILCLLVNSYLIGRICVKQVSLKCIAK